MPEQAAKTSKAQEKRESQPREPQSAEAAVALAERAPLAAAGTGDDPSARHAGLLGDARIGRMSVGQRAGLVRQLQRGYGNGHVARAMARAQSSTIAQRAPAETTHMPEESPHAPEQSIGAEAQPQAQTVQRNILGDLGDAVGDVASAVADPRKAFLSKAADFAKNIPGYTMLTLALGKDPISGNAVERNAKNVFHAVLGMVPGGEKIFASLDESGAIDKAFAWLEEQFAQLGLNFDTIKGLFKRAWDALSLTDLADPFGAFEKIKSIFVEPIVRLKNFVTAIGEKVLEFVFEGVMTKLGGGPVMGMLQKAGSALKQIIKDPIGFLSNLLSGVKQGFLNFKEHILSHLGKGLMTWLFGELASGGITLPKSFDLKGILELVMQVLGLTWTNLRAQAAKVLGEKTVARLESGAVAGFKIFKIVSEQGIGGLWEYIKEQIGNLKDMVIDGIKELVTSQVVQAGIQWLIGMLGGPAGALVKAIQTIYNVVMWFVNNASRLTELIGSIGDSIGAIANGAVGQAAKFIETALSNSVPVLLGLLANLLGLGNLSQKIKGVIEKIQAPIKKAMGWVLGKAKGFAAKIGGGLKKVGGKVKDAVKKKLGIKDKTPEERLEKGLSAGVKAINAFKKVPLVGEPMLRGALAGVRTLYGLSVLEPVDMNGYWGVRGDVQRIVNPRKTDVKKSGDEIVNLESLHGWRPKFSSSTETELAQIYPEHHEDGTNKLLSIELTSKKGKKYQKSLNDRRHITSFDDIKSRTIKELHGVPFRDAIITLQNKGFTPRKENNESIVKATKSYLTKVFNDTANLYVGDSKDNQERGTAISQYKGELEQLLASGDENKARIAYEKYRSVAFDPEPIEYFFDKYRSFRE